MNLDELERKLMAAARSAPPNERVPWAFEKRIMARLAGRLGADDRALWARAWWRAAAACAGVMVLLSAWTWLTPPGGAPANDLSRALEQTLLAAAELEFPGDWN
ncbi:MAG TPA: hypothetical protein PKN20_02745 [Verrucomicrobiota bacterium]|jgi:hypothetical protein|nr:hypothetical protein [Verrucomicrobiota bacterium]HOH39129.1 hypothetical protein [Verrucomicrobiota bacterium]